MTIAYSVLTFVFIQYMGTTSYNGRSYFVTTPSISVAIFAITTALIPIAWLPISYTRPSQLLYWSIYSLVYVPGILMLHMYTFDIFQALPMTTALIAGMAIIGMFYWIPRISIPLPTIRQRTAVGVLWILAAGLVIFIHSTAGFEVRTITPTGGHEARAAWKASASALPSILERLVIYSIMWLKNVIFPAILALGIVSRDWRQIITGITGISLVFVTGGWRSAIFVVVIITILGIVLSRDIVKQNFFALFLSCITVGIITAISYSYLIGSPLLSGVVRRFVVAQGAHIPRYFEFFGDPSNPYIYLSDRPFMPFLNYPYDTTAADVIGREYYSDVGNIHANAGSWADGYANFGLPGVLLFSVFLGTYFWVFDSISKGLDFRLSCMLIGGIVIVVANTTFFTLLLTHGLGLLLVIVAIIAASQKPTSMSILN